MLDPKFLLNRYDFEDLQFELSRDLKKPVSRSTLYRWLNELRISTDEFGKYHFEDLQLLREWLQAKPFFKTFERFRAYKFQQFQQKQQEKK